jgi:hypothetical protein
MSIKETLMQEIEVCLRMTNLAINNMDDQHWGEVSNNWSYAKTLHHVISTFEFYIQDGPEAERLGLNTQGKTDEELHQIFGSKDHEFFRDYFQQVEHLVMEHMNGFNDKQLLMTDAFGEWGFKNRLHKFSYLFRHTMIHLGELSKTLRDQHRDVVRWL